MVSLAWRQSHTSKIFAFVWSFLVSADLQSVCECRRNCLDVSASRFWNCWSRILYKLSSSIAKSSCHLYSWRVLFYCYYHLHPLFLWLVTVTLPLWLLWYPTITTPATAITILLLLQLLQLPWILLLASIMVLQMVILTLRRKLDYRKESPTSVIFPQERKGSNYSCDQLKVLFSQFGFTISIYKNLTVQELKSTLNKCKCIQEWIELCILYVNPWVYKKSSLIYSF